MRTDKIEMLECPHCDGVAVTSDENGHFWDGMGRTTGCETCGYPGEVSCDSDGASWDAFQPQRARCKLTNCSECT